MFDGETFEIGIGLAFVEAVHLGRIIAGADAGAADIQTQFRGMKQFMKETLARLRRELAEEQSRRVCKSSAEAKNFLKFFLGI